MAGVQYNMFSTNNYTIVWNLLIYNFESAEMTGDMSKNIKCR
jgi:hypothetical protein